MILCLFPLHAGYDPCTVLCDVIDVAFITRRHDEGVEYGTWHHRTASLYSLCTAYYRTIVDAPYEADSESEKVLNSHNAAPSILCTRRSMHSIIVLV